MTWQLTTYRKMQEFNFGKNTTNKIDVQTTVPLTEFQEENKHLFSCLFSEYS